MVQRRTSKKTAIKKDDAPEFKFENEVVIVGHLIKYNLYLLAKTIIFNALLSTAGADEDLTPEEAADRTNRIIDELDLDTKRRLQQ